MSRLYEGQGGGGQKKTVAQNVLKHILVLECLKSDAIFSKWPISMAQVFVSSHSGVTMHASVQASETRQELGHKQV